MSTDNTLDVKRLTRISFDQNFLPARIEGEKLDMSMTSLLVTTFQRIFRTIGERLNLGTAKEVRTLSMGRLLTITFSDELHTFEVFDAVSAWNDLDDAGDETVDAMSEYPLLPGYMEIRQLLEESTAAHSCSFQRLTSGNWEHFTYDDSLEIIPLETSAMLLLQMDVLCREQKLPRGRMRLTFEEGALWFWVTELENLMLVVASNDLSAEDQDCIHRCGEAFLIL